MTLIATFFFAGRTHAFQISYMKVIEKYDNANKTVRENFHTVLFLLTPVPANRL